MPYRHLLHISSASTVAAIDYRNVTTQNIQLTEHLLRQAASSRQTISACSQGELFSFSQLAARLREVLIFELYSLFYEENAIFSRLQIILTGYKKKGRRYMSASSLSLKSQALQTFKRIPCKSCSVKFYSQNSFNLAIFSTLKRIKKYTRIFSHLFVNGNQVFC